MGGISVGRVLRPLLWLFLLVLTSIVFPLLLAVMTPFFLLFWFIGLVSASFRDYMGATFVGVVVWLPLWFLIIIGAIAPALALAYAAVIYLDSQVPSQLPALVEYLVRHLPRDLRPWWAAFDPSRREWAWLCVTTGAVAFSSNLVYAFLDIPWRLKQIRLVRALPRSKVRSVSIGLAEFEGIVRVTGGDHLVSKHGELEAKPFYLEDETGRILVDPGRAAIRASTASGASLQLNEIEAGIRDGDRVYVIGNVQLRKRVDTSTMDTDSLVVRPLRQSLVSSPVARLLFTKGNQTAERDAPNIFIVDKGHEHNVLMRLRMALWDFCAIGVIYMAASLWLVHAVWDWLPPV